MGIETLFLISAGLSLAQGVSAMGEASKQADIAKKETAKAQQQSALETKKNIARNVTLFAKSGINLQGSPLLAIEQDIQTGVANVDDIAMAGKAQVNSIKSQGRQAFLSSVGSGITSAAMGMK